MKIDLAYELKMKIEIYTRLIKKKNVLRMFLFVQLMPTIREVGFNLADNYVGALPRRFLFAELLAVRFMEARRTEQFKV